MICKDGDPQRLRRLLLDGAESPPGPSADASYFEALRSRISRDDHGA